MIVRFVKPIMFALTYKLSSFEKYNSLIRLIKANVLSITFKYWRFFKSALTGNLYLALNSLTIAQLFSFTDGEKVSAFTDRFRWS
jgi:hypothetical protein